MKTVIVIYCLLSLFQTPAVSLGELELDTRVEACNTLLPQLTYTLAFSADFVGEEESVSSILVCEWGSK